MAYLKAQMSSVGYTLYAHSILVFTDWGYIGDRKYDTFSLEIPPQDL